MANFVNEKDLEKVDMVEITNKYAKLGLSEDDATFYESFPAKKQKKMLWKVDIRLVPFLALLYLAAHIDRANIGNAKIEGLVEDLNMTGIQVSAMSAFSFTPPEMLTVGSTTSPLVFSSFRTSCLRFLRMSSSRNSNVPALTSEFSS